MSAELIAVVVGILTLAGGQVATALVLVARMDRLAERYDKRFDDINQRFEDVNRRFEDVNRRFDEVNKRFDEVNKRFDEVNKRFDAMMLAFAEFRERVARLEGALEVFLAGRNDRDAA